MKVLIINFNRLILPVRMANWLAERGCEPIFIDNNSTYPPLFEYYKHCPYCVVMSNMNCGHLVVWEQGILKKLGIEGNYIVTDPDLDLTNIPDNFLEVLEEGLRRYPEFDKCGFSLEINDLPDIDSAKIVLGVENNYWRNPLDKEYFAASIDTTFALYKVNFFSMNAIRTNRPYTARHVTWYYDHIKDLPADEQYYSNTANQSSSGNARIRR
jgi:hypothetical protein